jgi:predicted TIM-barrel fold metal-dependent hydrolase
MTKFHLLAVVAVHLSVFAATPPLTAPDQILLKDYRPKSIFKIPETKIQKARYPVIDVHSHVYATNDTAVDQWVKTMDEVGLAKSVILSGATGEKLAAIIKRFSRYPERFEVWAGFDFTGYDQPGWTNKALADLENSKWLGARGIGEIHDKGRGLPNAPGLHIDDPRMDPLIEKCADLRLPINLHIGEDQWMYEPMDQTNDGLMNAYTWRIPKDTNVLGHPEVLATLERALQKHKRTTIIACHLANCCADLNRLGQLLDQSPNLYADIGARFAELTPIPRTVNKFFTKYQDRLLYGTDNTPAPGMYQTSFRILETDDEHFYPQYFAKYHWPAHAFALPDPVLKKLYRDNALKILSK